jgi:tetratricopeptide (TPR) repeat protein
MKTHLLELLFSFLTFLFDFVASQHIESYHKIELFLQHKKELFKLWSTSSSSSSSHETPTTTPTPPPTRSNHHPLENISSMDIVCRGDPPIYDPNFRQRGLNGDIVTNFKQLYDCGLTAKITFDSILNKIAKSFHLKSYSWDGVHGTPSPPTGGTGTSGPSSSNSETSIPEMNEIGLILCPLKPAERATQKIQDLYSKIEPGPPESWLYDLVRASFICETESQLTSISDALQHSSLFEVIQIYNHFLTPYPSGYRVVVLNIRVQIKNKQGHTIPFICEVTLHHQQLRRAYLNYKYDAVEEDPERVLSSLLVRQETNIGRMSRHIIEQKNRNLVEIFDRLIVEVNQVKLDEQTANSGGTLKEDFIIVECLLALAEVAFQQIQQSSTTTANNNPRVANSSASSITSNTPPPNSASPEVQDDDEEAECLIRSWVDLLTFFHQYEWAEKYQRLLLIKYLVPKYSEDHAEVAEALDQLASILNQEGKHTLSIQLYEKSIYVKTRIYGERHGLVANTLYTMAEVMTGQGKYAMAIPLHEQVLLIRRQVYGNNHSSVGQSLESLGKLMEVQNKIEPAKVPNLVLPLVTRPASSFLPLELLPRGDCNLPGGVWRPPSSHP